MFGLFISGYWDFGLFSFGIWIFWCLEGILVSDLIYRSVWVGFWFLQLVYELLIFMRTKGVQLYIWIFSTAQYKL